MENENKKRLEFETQQVTDERGRTWYLWLGKLTGMDIDDADKGLLNLKGTFDFDGAVQGIQYILDSPFKGEDGRFVKRLGTVFAGELIRQLVNDMGVSSLSDFNNRYWYAMYEEKPGWGVNSFIRGIAHPNDKSKYIVWKDVIEEVKGMDWTKDQKDDN